MDLCLRFANEDELPLVWSMYEDAKTYEGCVWDDEYPSKEILIDDFNNSTLCVLVLKNQIIGAITIVFDDYLDDFKCWKIQTVKAVSFARVVIAKDFLGCGYGTRMVEMLLNILKESGWDVVRILVSPDNPSAIAIYKKLGFEFLCIDSAFDENYWLCEKALN